MSADPTIEERLASADPRAVEYLRLRWPERWPTLAPFDGYPPAAWSDAIRPWGACELTRAEALLPRVDAILNREAA